MAPKKLKTREECELCAKETKCLAELNNRVLCARCFDKELTSFVEGRRLKVSVTIAQRSHLFLLLSCFLKKTQYRCILQFRPLYLEDRKFQRVRKATSSEIYDMCLSKLSVNSKQLHINEKCTKCNAASRPMSEFNGLPLCPSCFKKELLAFAERQGIVLPVIAN